MKEKKSTNVAVSDKIYWLTRLSILAVIIAMFVPALNPAKISSLINKGLSFFTTGVSWETLINGAGQAFRFANLSYDTYYMIRVAAIIAIVGTVAIGAAVCMSLGSLKLKRLGNIFSLVGSVAIVASTVVCKLAHGTLVDELSGLSVVAETPEPVGITVFFILGVVILITTIANMILLPKPTETDVYKIDTQYKLFLVLVPFIALILLFSYLPLFGWRYAFFDYETGIPLSRDNFVGFKWFSMIFTDSAMLKDVVRVLRNTLVMSGLGIATSWLPMAFAIFLNEVKCGWFKKAVQVFTTIPNFVSWVLVYTIAFALFSSDGFFETVLKQIGMGGNHDFLGNPSGMWFKMLLWGTWKGLGWSAIIYIAGISGIDPQLYEAATVDGAGRAQKMWHITLPGLLPTFSVLLLMNVANVLTNGMDQYLVFQTAKNKDTITVLDLYVYQLISDTAFIPLSTVVSMFKSLVSVILLFGANGISKLVRGESIM